MNKQWIEACFGREDNIRYADMDYLLELAGAALDAQRTGTWKDITIDISGPYGDQIVLRGKRLETDSEYRKRTEYEEKQKQIRRNLYENLKKEFGE